MEGYQKLIIFGLIALIVLYLMFREFNTWYWKINKRISLQEETNKLLKQILKTQIRESLTEVTNSHIEDKESTVEKEQPSKKEERPTENENQKITYTANNIPEPEHYKNVYVVDKNSWKSITLTAKEWIEIKNQEKTSGYEVIKYV
jgi:hypothetical protein